MVRTISTIAISIAIIVSGYIAFQKLGYWERSSRIFKYDSTAIPERGMGRGFGRFEGRGGGEFQREAGSRRGEGRFGQGAINDSPGRRPEEGRREAFGDNVPDSLRNTVRHEALFRERGRGEGRGGGFHGESGIHLGSVAWFLAVFSGITVITIWFDKLASLALKKLRARR